MEKELTLIDIWRILWKRKILILTIFIGSEIVTFVISKKMTPLYEARISLLPPSSEKLPSPGFIPYFTSFEIPSPSVSMILALLQSNKICEEIVKKLNLKEHYNRKEIRSAVSILRKRTRIRKTKEGVIEIRVRDESPDVAVAIANLYPQILNKLNEELKLTAINPMAKVLDKPYLPKKPAVPNIKLNLLIAALISLIIGSIIALIKETV